MRVTPPEVVRAQFAATHARVMAQFDDLDSVIDRIRGQMVDDGLIRDPRSRTRQSDRTAPAGGSQ